MHFKSSRTGSTETNKIFTFKKKKERHNITQHQIFVIIIFFKRFCKSSTLFLTTNVVVKNKMRSPNCSSETITTLQAQVQMCQKPAILNFFFRFLPTVCENCRSTMFVPLPILSKWVTIIAHKVLPNYSDSPIDSMQKCRFWP